MKKVKLDVVCRCFCNATCTGNYDTCISLGTCQELDNFKYSVLENDK